MSVFESFSTTGVFMSQSVAGSITPGLENESLPAFTVNISSSFSHQSKKAKYYWLTAHFFQVRQDVESLSAPPLGLRRAAD